MKIAFYGQPLLNENKTGIGYYEDGLLKGLLKEYPENDYIVDIFTSAGGERKRRHIREYGKKVKISECGWISERLFKLISLIIEIPYVWLFREKRDITHFCNYVIPFGVQGKKVVTIHDMAFREYPETVRKRTMIMLQRNLKRSVKRADLIVTDSFFTKKEILKYYKVSSQKIEVVPCGVDTVRFHPGYRRTQVADVKSKYHIEGEYFLYLGTLEPRKNLQGLLLAYKIFYDKIRISGNGVPKLVLAGGKGWMYDDIFRTAEELFSEDEVLFTGYVDEEDKALLMSGALVFCFPSFYEGFGMPPLEAMACGVPVLTSNTSSLAEVTGDAALQTDPGDTEAIAEAMCRLYQEEELRQQLRIRGLEQVKKYSWESAAEKLQGVYDRVIND